MLAVATGEPEDGQRTHAARFGREEGSLLPAS